jgi:hypothetical protein
MKAASEAPGLGGTRKSGGNEGSSGNRRQQSLVHRDLLHLLFSQQETATIIPSAIDPRVYPRRSNAMTRSS